MAAIHAGRGGSPALVLDGQMRIGAKILVAGGGRCNVTHHEVLPKDYAGSSRNAIAKVLREFTVEDTITFFNELGVRLKKEETGKLFPTTDKSRTVLDALTHAVNDSGGEIRYPSRVTAITRTESGTFEILGDDFTIEADRVVLATGGKALPKSGSDGFGHSLASKLGHTITSEVFPSLVPLKLPEGDPLCGLSGITLPATFTIRSTQGKSLEEFSNSTLLTHFGISGPSVLDISRYFIMRKRAGEMVVLHANWLPEYSSATLDSEILSHARNGVGPWLREHLPERFVRSMLELVHTPPATPGRAMNRDARKRLVELITKMPMDVTGDRGFAHAEATAGGVPLREVELSTMESRICPGMHLIGEILDVDGRIGGFNFQWAWASGAVAGRALAAT